VKLFGIYVRSEIELSSDNLRVIEGKIQAEIVSFLQVAFGLLFEILAP